MFGLTFAQPACLLLLLAVPPLLWWWLRRRRAALRYSDLSLFADLPSGRAQLARWAGIVLRAAVLVLLIIALAGPRWPDHGSRIPTEGIAIVMLLDVSGSMAEPFGELPPRSVSEGISSPTQTLTRFEAAKNAFRLFVEGGETPDGERLGGRPSDLIGLVAFARRPDSVCPLTLSHAVLLDLLDREQLRPVGESDTNISDAIVIGLHRLQSAGALRTVLILLSDGGNLRIPIYAINTEGEPTATTTGGTSPRERLEAAARITGGKYFEARDPAALAQVYKEIDALERSEIESFQYRRYYEGFAWFGLAALVALVCLQALEMTLWQRLP